MRHSLRLPDALDPMTTGKIVTGALLVLLVGSVEDAVAQVTVRDSLGAPVPYAILEAPDGRRTTTGANGVAATVSPATGPWAARRIGYRPAKDDDTVIPIPVQPSSEEYVSGRAVIRVDGEWAIRLPGLAAMAADGFLGAHCRWVEAGSSDETAVIRFAPAREVAGPNLSGAFVVQRATGRLLSDTLVLQSPPKGAPGAARMVGTYEEATFTGDPIPLPRLMVETVRPAALHVRLDGSDFASPRRSVGSNVFPPGQDRRGRDGRTARRPPLCSAV